jgi:hypothetical protein
MQREKAARGAVNGGDDVNGLFFVPTNVNISSSSLV